VDGHGRFALFPRWGGLDDIRNRPEWSLMAGQRDGVVELRLMEIS
jgi:hypothetical protein